ncbi:MAG: amino-acid N-acetyltransferase [Spirochaetia bacterium]|nr:amino-acid N-acetyltransferase [Spirochaetia bacterium]
MDYIIAEEELTAGQRQVQTIREVFHYLHQFKGKCFVIKIDCSIIEHPQFPMFIKDIVRLRDTGIGIVLIPGAKERIDQVLSDYGIVSQWENNIRITDNNMIPFVKMAAFDVANRIMTSLAAAGCTAVIGNWVRARGIGVVDGVDYQNTGFPEKIMTSDVLRIISDGVIPILPCVGWSSVGKPYNIASDDLAVITASRLGADKLFFMTSYGGYNAADYELPAGTVVSTDGKISNFSLQGIQQFFRLNKMSPELDLLEKAKRACESGVARVHILDGCSDGVLLREIFSNLGSGTMVYSNAYSGIRSMRPDEIGDVLRVMKPFVDKDILLPRTEEMIEACLNDYIVFEIDGAIHASCALHVYPEGVGEIAGIAVDRNYSHLGVGPKLVDYLCERGRKMGLQKVFVLTTRTSDWFLSLGFEEGDLASLPEKKRAAYNYSRKSRIFVKNL